MTKAPFWKRFIAMFIDGFLFGGMFSLLRNPSVFLLFVIYETILISQWDGHTIGKKIMGIKVVMVSGGKVDWVKAFVRSISRLLSALPLFLAIFGCFGIRSPETWHDKLADTIVVEA